MEKTNRCSIQFIYMCFGQQYDCKHNYNGEGSCDYWADGWCTCDKAKQEATDTLKKSKWMEVKEEQENGKEAQKEAVSEN